MLRLKRKSIGLELMSFTGYQIKKGQLRDILQIQLEKYKTLDNPPTNIIAQTIRLFFSGSGSEGRKVAEDYEQFVLNLYSKSTVSMDQEANALIEQQEEILAQIEKEKFDKEFNSKEKAGSKTISSNIPAIIEKQDHEKYEEQLLKAVLSHARDKCSSGRLKNSKRFRIRLLEGICEYFGMSQEQLDYQYKKMLSKIFLNAPLVNHQINEYKIEFLLQVVAELEEACCLTYRSRDLDNNKLNI